MLRNVMLAGAAILLSGCEVPVMIAAAQNDGQMTGAFEITFPAMMLVQFDDGSEELLPGELRGHANGSAEYTVTGPTWGTCEGKVTRAGDIDMTCDGGVAIKMNVGAQRPKMSGVNVASGVALGTPYKSAFGWGKSGTEAAVRAALE
ncbi:hypothetical protein [Shimia ponticola]|uniref:hypothetical protein n=1 Tax=Shimia ponticola TaxID=2582893 RepID=UPI0011BFB3A3|nr:hypothetical protein [Shimia ponticola]